MIKVKGGKVAIKGNPSDCATELALALCAFEKLTSEYDAEIYEKLKEVVDGIENDKIEISKEKFLEKLGLVLGIKED